VAAPGAPRAAVIEPNRFFYADNFNVPQIQAYLDTQPGPLKDFRTSVGNREHSFAEILGSQTSLYSINPQVVLALIEQQSGLITQPGTDAERLDWALNFRGENGNYRGLMTQVRWAIRELHRAQRDFPAGPELVYSDASHSPMPAGLNLGGYAVARVLAATTTADGLVAKLEGGNDSFVAVFTRLFGDPRVPAETVHSVAEPFLTLPLDRPYAISSFFDHDAPFLQHNGSIVTYRGDRDPVLSYDGHDGWDYAARPPAPVLAAADGTVVFAGNSDDGCGVAYAVIIDHGNGYRTLYWHLDEVLIEPGPVTGGTRIGIVGASGCVTGPHLHFQVQFLGRDTDPYGWCGPAGQNPWAAHPAGSDDTWLWASMPSPCDLPSNALVVEPGDPAWRKSGAGWEEVAGGVGGASMRNLTVPVMSADVPVAVWVPSIPAAGMYRVMAWVPYVANGVPDPTAARYIVRHAGGETSVPVDQSAVANTWVDLGIYEFTPDGRHFVGLAAVDATSGTNMWYDAMIWMPVE
jgi:murein DD-endopeptidase MepM/ murein hydrolase activator NlpD